MTDTGPVTAGDVTSSEETETVPVPGESKADAFKRLARKRVTVALDKIRLIGNLANRGSYEYTEQQALAIRAALEGAVNDAMLPFEAKTVKKGFDFD